MVLLYEARVAAGEPVDFFAGVFDALGDNLSDLGKYSDIKFHTLTVL